MRRTQYSYFGEVFNCLTVMLVVMLVVMTVRTSVEKVPFEKAAPLCPSVIPAPRSARARD